MSSPLEEKRERTRSVLQETRKRIRDINAEIAEDESAVTTRAEAKRKVVEWVDRRAAAVDLNAFKRELINTGKVDESTLPNDPLTVTAVTDPDTLKNWLIEACCDGLFPENSCTPRLDKLRLQRDQLLEDERRLESDLRYLDVDLDPAEVQA